MQSPLRNAIRVSCARAALQLHDGESRKAEVTLRVALNGSLLLVEEGPNELDLLMGLAMARMVGSALASFYEVTGRPREAASLLDALHHPEHTALPERLTGSPLTVKDVIEALPEAVRLPDLPPAYKWERLLSVQLVQVQAYCVGEDALGAHHAEWLPRGRPGMGDQPRGSAHFQWSTPKAPARGRA